VADPAPRTALVTGGTSGIGLAVTRLLASRGFRTFICARSADAVAATVKELREQDLDVGGTNCDVTDTGSIAAFVGTAKERVRPDLGSGQQRRPQRRRGHL